MNEGLHFPPYFRENGRLGVTVEWDLPGVDCRISCDRARKAVDGLNSMVKITIR